jgi:pyruvate formate lyase activating enzyme
MKELGVWVELTTLIIPTYNDSKNFLKWVAEFIKYVSPKIPWPVTQFFPKYKLQDQPRTPVRALIMARDIWMKAGLKYVYEGNVRGEVGESTYCHSCGELLIGLMGYALGAIKIKDSKRLNCDAKLSGVGLP